MTDRVFNLLREAWLPVRRLSGAGELLRPRDLTDGIHEDPIVAFDWGRPDFDTASREFLIGLLSTACAARVLDGRAWRDWWRNPPSADALDASLASFADAFDLDGDGPRFMQDREDFAGAAVPVEALLIDSPGENTIKFNKDLFVRRGRVGTLSRGAAAMALFALHTYAPEGGRGLCTGLRGGGPMTCTVLPDADDAPALWHRLWLNTFAGDDWLQPATDDRPIFPWTVATRVSDKGVNTTPEHAHPAACFWGMPRRIRLDFEANEGARACDLIGIVDEVLVASYRSKPKGNKYEAWGRKHPLTPYYRSKPTDVEWLALHPQPGRPGYGDWLGLVIADDADPARILRQPPAIVASAENRLDGLRRAGRPLLHIAGYDTRQRTARGFVEHEMPLVVVEEELRQECDLVLRAWIRGAREAEGLLDSAVQRALGEKKRDQGQRWIVGERFWAETEPAFLERARRLPDHLRVDVDETALAGDWLVQLRRHVLRLFDEAVPPASIDATDPKPYVAARSMLHAGMRGYGKQGRRLFAALDLKAPESRRKEKAA